MTAIAFATLASAGYIGHAAGLFLNLRRVHPEVPLIVGALDGAARTAFTRRESEGLYCVDAEDIWGRPFWENMCCRMTRPERAFASKPALIEWVLANRADAVILLDSDLLFLERVDDLLAQLAHHRIVLMPGRHPLRNWSKARDHGLFSAGIIGLTKAALQPVREWKALCFETCTAMPLTGQYYEQTYLDMFAGLPGAAIVHDDGVNVSQTILARLAPRQSGDRWLVGGGTPLRVYHASRSSNTSFPLYQAKERLNTEGLAHLGIATSRPRGELGRQSLLGRFVRAVHLGRVADRTLKSLPVFARWLMESWRLITVSDRPLDERLLRARRDKRLLMASLLATADVDRDRTP